MSRNPTRARRILWMSQHWLPRGGLHMQGFGVFRRAGREAFFQCCGFFQVSNLEESHQNLWKNIRKNRFIVGNQRDFWEALPVEISSNIPFRACFFLWGKTGPQCRMPSLVLGAMDLGKMPSGGWLHCFWLVEGLISSPGFNGNYCLIWFFHHDWYYRRCKDVVRILCIYVACVYIHVIFWWFFRIAISRGHMVGMWETKAPALDVRLTDGQAQRWNKKPVGIKWSLVESKKIGSNWRLTIPQEKLWSFLVSKSFWEIFWVCPAAFD